MGCGSSKATSVREATSKPSPEHDALVDSERNQGESQAGARSGPQRKACEITGDRRSDHVAEEETQADTANTAATQQQSTYTFTAAHSDGRTEAAAIIRAAQSRAERVDDARTSSDSRSLVNHGQQLASADGGLGGSPLDSGRQAQARQHSLANSPVIRNLQKELNLVDEENQGRAADVEPVTPPSSASPNQQGETQLRNAPRGQ